MSDIKEMVRQFTKCGFNQYTIKEHDIEYIVSSYANTHEIFRNSAYFFDDSNLDKKIVKTLYASAEIESMSSAEDFIKLFNKLAGKRVLKLAPVDIYKDDPPEGYKPDGKIRLLVEGAACITGTIKFNRMLQFVQTVDPEHGIQNVEARNDNIPGHSILSEESSNPYFEEVKCFSIKYRDRMGGRSEVSVDLTYEQAKSRAQNIAYYYDSLCDLNHPKKPEISTSDGSDFIQKEPKTLDEMIDEMIEQANEDDNNE